MNKMSAQRILEQILHYHPRGQKSIGYPMKERWEGNMTP